MLADARLVGWAKRLAMAHIGIWAIRTLQIDSPKKIIKQKKKKNQNYGPKQKAQPKKKKTCSE